MNKEAQRVAIAEWCGWSQRKAKKSNHFAWFSPNGNRWSEWSSKDDIETLPDYLNDLNAIHEAEGRLSDGQIVPYLDHLLKIVELDWRMCRASASQRAEALLKTLGLWKEESLSPDSSETKTNKTKG